MCKTTTELRTPPFNQDTLISCPKSVWSTYCIERLLQLVLLITIIQQNLPAVNTLGALTYLRCPDKGEILSVATHQYIKYLWV